MHHRPPNRQLVQLRKGNSCIHYNSKNTWPRQIYQKKCPSFIQSPLQADMSCIWKAASRARDEDNMVGKLKAINYHCGAKDNYSLGNPYRDVCAQEEIQDSRYSPGVLFAAHTPSPCAKWSQHSVLAGVIKPVTLCTAQHLCGQVIPDMSHISA